MSQRLIDDALQNRIEPLLPKPPRRRWKTMGRPRVPDRAALTGILFVLRSGLPWQMLPKEMGYGSGRTARVASPRDPHPTRQAPHAPWQWARSHAVGRGTHVGLAPSVSPPQYARRTSALYSRGVPHVVTVVDENSRQLRSAWWHFQFFELTTADFVSLSGVVDAMTARLADWVLVCSNCHRAIHRKRLWLGVDAIRYRVRPTA